MPYFSDWRQLGVNLKYSSHTFVFLNSVRIMRTCMRIAAKVSISVCLTSDDPGEA